MKEEFLHYVWKYGLFYARSFTDTDGNPVEVISPGEYNRDSGPDFFNSRIRTGGTEWAGNVEIHIKSSHFELHGHHRDHAYDNVILHVVAENDRPVRNARGQEILTAEIRFDEGILEKYNNLVNNPASIACQKDIQAIDRFCLRHWIHSLMVERLTEKSRIISSVFSETGNDWDETFYRFLCRYFGFRVNAEPFGMLAAALPFRIIRKHADNRFQVEALLFGTAGMLEEGLFRNAINDEYYLELIKEYRILSSKYSLKPVHGWLWKFSRLRPVNFPTVRISQLAAMLTVAGGLFSRILEIKDTVELKKCFEVSASGYWNDHYVFGKKSRNAGKRTGDTATDILLINSVIPVLFAYGITRNNSEITERALTFLEDTAPEANVIISEWKACGIMAESAFDSQALIQLRNEYCRKRRCLECRIGIKIISSGAGLLPEDQLLLDPLP